MFSECFHSEKCKRTEVFIRELSECFQSKLQAAGCFQLLPPPGAELIRRELATADELVVDEAGEAAMAACNAAKTRATASKAASKVAREANIKKERLAAALDAAKQNEANAGLKRQLAQGRLKIADMQAKVAKAATPLMSEPSTSKTAPLRGTLDAFLRPAPSK